MKELQEKEVVDFLKGVQPMPDDNSLTEDLIEQYDNARKYLIKHPSEEGIRLLLNSFGSGDGWGVYQLVEDAVASLSSDLATRHIRDALTSSYESIRYWTSQISANYYDRTFIEPLLMLLHDPSDDIRLAALISIEKYMDQSLAAKLRAILLNEPNSEIRTMINKMVSQEM